LSECVLDRPGTELVCYYENKRTLLCVGRSVGRDVWLVWELQLEWLRTVLVDKPDNS